MTTENKEDLVEQSKERAEFIGLQQFDVTLNYGFLSEPIIFPCKIMLNADDRAARQAFYSKSQGDQAKGAFDFNVDFMLRCVVDNPKGLPGYVQVDRPRVKENLAAYFSTGEPILQKIADDFGNVYTQQTTPPAFFR